MSLRQRRKGSSYSYKIHYRVRDERRWKRVARRSSVELRSQMKATSDVGRGLSVIQESVLVVLASSRSVRRYSIFNWRKKKEGGGEPGGK